MDAIRKLAEKLKHHKPEQKPFKRNHTIHVDHKAYMLLYSYCRRKGVPVGDVIGDLIKGLIADLETKGELTIDDTNKAEELTKESKDREDRKRLKSIDEAAVLVEADENVGPPADSFVDALDTGSDQLTTLQKKKPA